MRILIPVSLAIVISPVLFLFVNATVPGWQPELHVEFRGLTANTVYTAAQAATDFESDSSLQGFGSITTITPGPLRSLRVTYPAGVFASGAKLRHRMSVPVQIAQTCVDMLVPSTFTPMSGGMLPLGFGGSVSPYQIPTGGTYKPTGKDGFSVRLMWISDNRVSAYVYYPGQTTNYGVNFYHTQRLQRGKWDNICLRVQLNQVGQSNGVLYVKVNGVWNTFSGLNFRTISSLKIDHYLHETFFNNAAPTVPQIIDFDRFHIQAQF